MNILLKNIVIVSAFLLLSNCFAEPIIKSGESLAFMGDSITQFGAGQPSGYVRLVISGFKANGIDVTPFPAGISGHKSNQMLERLDRHVISKKPTWMTLSCGVNDVMHGANGIELEPYKENITEIVNETLSNGIKVVILTSTMISEDKDAKNNIKLDQYNVFLRQLAAEKKCPVADLNQLMKDGIEAKGGYNNKIKYYTVDGVHMDLAGNLMMAEGVLRAFGLDDAMIEKAQAYWETIPEACVINASKLTPKVSIAEKRKLEKIAADKGLSLDQMMVDSINAYIQQLLNSK